MVGKTLGHYEILEPFGAQSVGAGAAVIPDLRRPVLLYSGG